MISQDDSAYQQGPNTPNNYSGLKATNFLNDHFVPQWLGFLLFASPPFPSPPSSSQSKSSNSQYLNWIKPDLQETLRKITWGYPKIIQHIKYDPIIQTISQDRRSHSFLNGHFDPNWEYLPQNVFYKNPLILIIINFSPLFVWAFFGVWRPQSLFNGHFSPKGASLTKNIFYNKSLWWWTTLPFLPFLYGPFLVAEGWTDF